MVFHDATIDGVAVAELTCAQLQSRAGYLIPTLGQVLALARGRVATNIELKEPGYVAEVIDVLRVHGQPSTAIISSFIDEVVACVKDIDSTLTTGLVLGRRRPAAPLRTRLSELRPKKRLVDCRADYAIVNVILARLGVLNEVRKAGLQAFIWTVNNTSELSRYLSDPRVAGIITDQVTRALELKRMNTDYQLRLRREGRGPVLVLIHGVAGSSKLWDPVMPALASKYDVVRVDLLGYGYSPHPTLAYTPAVHVEAIKQTLIRHGIKPPYLLAGLSMGSLLVLEYAKRWPDEVAHLLCIGLPYYPTEAVAREYLRRSITARLALEWGIVGRLAVSGIWMVGRRSRIIAGLFSQIYTADMAREAMLASYQAFYSTLVSCMIDNRPDPLFDATARTKQSYLHGSGDRYTPAVVVEAALANRPNTTLTIMPDVNHNLVVLAPQQTAKWMIDSLGQP